MTLLGWMQLVLYLLLLLAITKPLGIYLTRIFAGERTLLDPILRPVERIIYRAARIDPEHEMRWTGYTASVLAFSLLGVLILYVLQRLQGVLPFNPQHLGAVSPDLSFNTAVSFTTNTNWQSYAGETTMSYLTQMIGLAYHNFVSAATGIAVAIALIRGLTRRSAREIGNFWVDLTRATLWLLLPVSIVFGLVLVSQGVVQNLNASTIVKTLEGAIQTIAQGPVASQEAIKMFGTNGGGFYNANSAHPFENPNPLTNLLEMLSIFAIPAALTYTFGRFARDQRQGWAILATMAILFVVGFAMCYPAEQAGNPALTRLGIDPVASSLQPGGNMEGKETRFGIANSALFATITTDASCGAVNSMHDSFTPIGGLVPLVNIMLGEVVFGGVGSGLYGMLIFAIFAVFIAGLMVGRTPEYLGKKIEAKEMKMAMLAVLIFPATVLGFTALAIVLPVGRSAIFNPGVHGFSEVLYAFTSTAGNNGSAFAGLGTNTSFYNILLGVAMYIGRFLVIIPTLAIAGSMVQKKAATESAGTFPTHGSLFVVLLIGVILIIGALTFIPALALGPIVEHLQMLGGKV